MEKANTEMPNTGDHDPVMAKINLKKWDTYLKQTKEEDIELHPSRHNFKTPLNAQKQKKHASNTKKNRRRNISTNE